MGNTNADYYAESEQHGHFSIFSNFFELLSARQRSKTPGSQVTADLSQTPVKNEKFRHFSKQALFRSSSHLEQTPIPRSNSDDAHSTSTSHLWRLKACPPLLATDLSLCPRCSCVIQKQPNNNIILLCIMLT